MLTAYACAAELSPTEVREILRRFIPRPVYNDWFRLAAGLVHTFGPYVACDIMTSVWPDEQPNETAKLVRAIDAGIPSRGSPVTIATVIWMASNRGFDFKDYLRRRRELLCPQERVSFRHLADKFSGENRTSRPSGGVSFLHLADRTADPKTQHQNKEKSQDY